MSNPATDNAGEAAADPQSLTGKTLSYASEPPAEGEAGGEISKNAAKKAAKQKKLAEEKAGKSKEKATGGESKKTAPKQAKKKIDGAALIGIDVAKEEDFSGWYQQVLTKGDMLDYYDVSGCYILKVGSIEVATI